MFFDYFPSTYFWIDSKTQVLVTDFIRVVKLDPELKNNSVFFDIYEAMDNETPEIISHKFYKSTQYHWVIMLLNERFDPHNDFPKSDNILQAAIEDAGLDPNAIDHYEDGNGNVVDVFHPSKTPITVLEAYRSKNEAKRTLKILKQDVLTEFVHQYKNLISV